MPCLRTFHERLCEQATVRITPRVTIRDVDTFCVGGLVIGPCPGNRAAFCDVTVHQNLCVDVDLEFDAAAAVVATALVCGTPIAGECEEADNG